MGMGGGHPSPAEASKAIPGSYGTDASLVVVFGPVAWASEVRRNDGPMARFHFALISRSEQYR